MREIDECLLVALDRGDARDVLAALAQGADANVIDGSGHSALHIACEDARSELLVPALFRAGARMMQNADGLDPLETCCLNSHWIAACLLAEATEVCVQQRHLDTPDRYGTRLASGAAALGRTILLRKLALIDPSLALTCDAKGFDPFWHACESGSLRSADFLCSLAPANKSYLDGLTRLHLASRAGSPSMIKNLVERGARIGIIDQEGQSCMHHAAFSGSTLAARELLLAGESHCLPDTQGRFPLDVARSMRHYEIAAFLFALSERDHLQEESCKDESIPRLKNMNEGHDADQESDDKRGKRL